MNYIFIFKTIIYINKCQRVDNEGNLLTNCQDNTITVTWGVFPQKQVIQPTVVDYRSFLIWKKDAFNHWTSIWG